MINRRQFLGAVLGFGASPIVLRAQKPSVPLVGFISAASSDGFAYLAAAFRQGLQESGFVVGQNRHGNDRQLPLLLPMPVFYGFMLSKHCLLRTPA
ncbi:MAG: hypothetical protein ABI831_21050 [Betaproteobacteria bacterium]